MVTFQICRKPSRLNVSKDYQGIDWKQESEHRKASVRCKVEHVFLIVKRQFGYSKTAYRYYCSAFPYVNANVQLQFHLCQFAVISQDG